MLCKKLAGSAKIFGSFPVDISGKEELKKEIIESGLTIKPWGTFLIDLSQDKNALWSGLSHVARRVIKKCEAQHIIVERIKTEEDFKKYYKLLLETRKRLGLGMPPCFPNKLMMGSLQNKGTIEVFVAKKEGKWLSALGIIGFNGVITEMAVAQSNFSLKNKIYSNDLIKWAASPCLRAVMSIMVPSIWLSPSLIKVAVSSIQTGVPSFRVRQCSKSASEPRSWRVDVKAPRASGVG